MQSRRQESHVRRVFLWIPELGGHRQVYCRELCDYFLSRDLSITVATDLTGLREYEALERLAEHPRVRFIADTWSEEDRATAQLRALVAAAREAAADVTFLAEADSAHGPLLAQIGRSRQRLPGRRIGLFIRSTNYVHEVKRPQTGRMGQMIERPLLAAYKYRGLSPTQPRLFHEVAVDRLAVLDAALCLDEFFVGVQGGRHSWLPDIAVASEELPNGSAEAAAWQAEVSAFLATQHGRPVVVYSGTPVRRRGFGVLLELACSVGGLFIHCGRLTDALDYPIEAQGAKALLESRSAILELGGFYQSFETARITLGAAKCVVLPYNPAFYGSSGSMLQALMAGRPVLLSDEGLMAWRVRNFGLGLTFAPGEWRDMRYRFSILQDTPTEVFADRISRFLSYFSRAQFEAAMDGALGVRPVKACLPTPEETGLGGRLAERRS